MSDTPRTDSSELPHALDDHHFVVGSFFARQLERELNAASKERDDALMMLGMYRMKSDEQNQRIKRLEEELMDVKNKHSVLVADVALYEDRADRIHRLEDRINRAAMAFFRDGSDGHVASQMLQILEEERRQK